MNEKKQIKSILLAFTLAGVCCVPQMAQAEFTAGLWKSTHYMMNSDKRKAVKIDICVQADGSWQSIDSTDGMGGNWQARGREVHLGGNGRQVGGTGEIEEIVPGKLFTGTWQKWNLTGPVEYLGFTSKWEYANKPCTIADQSK